MNLSLWIAGARPRTLPAALAPVLIGTALAGAAWVPLRALLALIVALALQVGVNYANDYSDGIRGTDQTRVGPVRLVGQGLARPGAVRAAAFASFGVAGISGFVLVAWTGHWWLLIIGVSAIAAAWLYTGGPRPYGYAGLGEVFVFIYFGLVPVLGTMYVQTDTITPAAIAASVGIGALITGILVTNNLRDIPTDQQTGKRTLAVRLGDAMTRRLFAALIVVAYLAVIVMALTASSWTLLAFVSVAWAIRPWQVVTGGALGRDLIPALVATGGLVIAYSVSLSIGLVIEVLST